MYDDEITMGILLIIASIIACGWSYALGVSQGQINCSVVVDNAYNLDRK